ncbi:MAG: hypothetical protein AAF743_10615 [Planctomycetota bacterium]
MHFRSITLIVALAVGLVCHTTAADETPVTVTLDFATPGQTIDGFGASTAWYADDLMAMTPEARAGLIDELFGAHGLGLDILRVRIPPEPSESVERMYDFEDEKIRKQGQFIAEVQRRHDVQVMAVPWTAPAWMKDNDKENDGGFLKPEHYGHYATYLVDWVERMSELHGIEFHILSAQNEPGVKEWESMEWTTQQFATFVAEHLRPEMDRRGSELRLMINEETAWRSQRMIDDLLADERVAGATDIVAAHAYWNSFSEPEPITAAQDLGKPVWMTEFYFGHYNLKETTDPLRRLLAYGHVMDRFFDDAEVNAFLYWWAVSGPKDSLEGLIEVDLKGPEPIESFEPRRWTTVFAHYSRFVHPGWRRVPSTVSPTGEPFHDVAATVFMGPAGDDGAVGPLTIVLINSTDEPAVVQLAGLPTDVSLAWNGFLTTSARTMESQRHSPPDPSSVKLPPLSIMTLTATPE